MIPDGAGLRLSCGAHLALLGCAPDKLAFLTDLDINLFWLYYQKSPYLAISERKKRKTMADTGRCHQCLRRVNQALAFLLGACFFMALVGGIAFGAKFGLFCLVFFSIQPLSLYLLFWRKQPSLCRDPQHQANP